MPKSPALNFSLLIARFRRPERVASRNPRPPGRLIWLRASSDCSMAGLAQLALRLRRDMPDTALLVTREGVEAPDLGTFPDGTCADRSPRESQREIEHFLAHWRPDLVALAGAALPAALITACSRRRRPMLLVDLNLPVAVYRSWLWRRAMVAELLQQMRGVLVQDTASRSLIGRIGRGIAVEVTGRLEETTDPLPCNEAERAHLAALLRGRLAWLAVAMTETEEDAVLAAHVHGMRLAHRLLLILNPADLRRAAPIADRLAREGVSVAMRSLDEEPEDHVQVYIADTEGELGLWYRLAPITFIGGTLSAEGAARNPFEAAALGSAILHGPAHGPYPNAFARLSGADATRAVHGAPELGSALAELMAPDRAAALAHAAWAVSSGGAEVADRVVRRIAAALANASPTGPA